MSSLVRIDHVDTFTIHYFRILDISLEVAEVNAEGRGLGGGGAGGGWQFSNANEI